MEVSLSSGSAGARIMRQDPTECLFQFICSSNNHISRIHGMVERLCSKYGTPLDRTSLKESMAVPNDPVRFLCLCLFASVVGIEDFLC